MCINRSKTMKKIALFAILLMALCSVSACAKDDMVITTRAAITGADVTLAFEKGESFIHPLKILKVITINLPPQVAVWVEDPNGKYLETLYVTESAGTQGWSGQPGGTPGKKIRRPESLPYWSHKRGVVYPDGLYMPTRENPLADAVTGASPKGDFHLDTKVPQGLTKFVIMAEINLPGDYNEAFPESTSPGMPNEPGFVGVSGQPSLVWAADVDLTRGPATYELKPVGHGSPNGSDGTLNPDLSGLTTAKDIIRRITVTVK
jgi:hypothetical protein